MTPPTRTQSHCHCYDAIARQPSPLPPPSPVHPTASARFGRRRPAIVGPPPAHRACNGAAGVHCWDLLRHSYTLPTKQSFGSPNAASTGCASPGGFSASGLSPTLVHIHGERLPRHLPPHSLHRCRVWVGLCKVENQATRARAVLLVTSVSYLVPTCQAVSRSSNPVMQQPPLCEGILWGEHHLHSS